MTVKMTFEGGKELAAALEQIAEAAGSSRSGKEAMRRAGEQSLEPFAQAWRADVPVLFGDYQNSINIGNNLTPRQRRLKKAEPKVGMEVHAGTAVPQGVLQEFGTAHHPAQPSAIPAWERTRNQVLDKFKVLAWDELAKTAKRLAARLAKR